MQNLLKRFRNGFMNIVRWARIIWNDCDYSCESLLDVMRFKLRNMANYHELHGHLVNNGKHARQMRICAELCRRLSEDNYSVQAEWRYATYGGKKCVCRQRLSFDRPKDRKAKLKAAFESLQRQHDQKLLAKLLEKHLLNWWD